MHAYAVGGVHECTDLWYSRNNVLLVLRRGSSDLWHSTNDVVTSNIHAHLNIIQMMDCLQLVPVFLVTLLDLCFYLTRIAIDPVDSSACLSDLPLPLALYLSVQLV